MRASHLRDVDDVVAIVAAAQEKPLDGAYRKRIAEHLARHGNWR